VDIKTAYEFKASRQMVWDVLNDPRALEAAIPGADTLVEEGPDRYRAEMSVGVGLIRGRFGGTVIVRDKDEPNSYRMVVDGKGPGGWLKGEGKLALVEAGPEETIVTVDGDATMGGLLGRVGQGMVRNASNSLINQFFKNIEKEIARRKSG
jgi:carbon monoxide dehydrogenase subunit G